MNASAEICGTAPPELVALGEGDVLVLEQAASAVIARVAMKAVPAPRAGTLMFNISFLPLVSTASDLAGSGRNLGVGAGRRSTPEATAVLTNGRRYVSTELTGDFTTSDSISRGPLWTDLPATPDMFVDVAL
ncbi:hypothetical protein [Arthrobacter ramosus]|uniref:Uncharacterized protein n=1 Tax=Arthrobacter ramosus TaxID=1672 RepID=A0ABV5Y433_ARTRM|nr:hypothetical protein [Arthrobacter ramosus]